MALLSKCCLSTQVRFISSLDKSRCTRTVENLSAGPPGRETDW